ncbi:MAG: stage III sporulation protein AA, partial [Lachnospiraceae bacterium]
MQEILKNLPVEIRQAVLNQNIDFRLLTEIRMRLSKRLVLCYGKKEVWLNTVINKRHMSELLEFTTKHSAYAYENQLRQGYITVEGGHRIGFCGKVIIKDGQACGFKNISSANIRIAHEVKDCAAKVMPYIFENGNLYNTLIIAPPGCGKTTILRDII